VTGAGHPERWEPAPPSPRAVEAAEEQAPGAGAEVPRRWAVYGRGNARHRGPDMRRGGAGACCGGVWRRDGGDVSRGLSAR
jgi:hypothetical protein